MLTLRLMSKKKQFGSRFSESEDTFLRENYATMMAKDMAKKLGRPVASTMERLRSLNLKKKGRDKPAQTKVSQFFDNDLMPLIDLGAAEAGLSRSAFVNQLVHKALKTCPSFEVEELRTEIFLLKAYAQSLYEQIHGKRVA